MIQQLAVITVECSGKASFVKNCVQIKLMVGALENDPLALFNVSKPLISNSYSIPPDGEDNSAALPRDVVQLLESRSCDSEEIVLQWMQNLNLDKVCLEQPTPETTRMMRCFSAEAKFSKRSDVVKHLRDIAPAGTTGEFARSLIN